MYIYPRRLAYFTDFLKAPPQVNSKSDPRCSTLHGPYINISLTRRAVPYITLSNEDISATVGYISAARAVFCKLLKMVSAWLMDNSDADQRLPHKREPHEPVSLDELKELGVLYWCV